MLLIALNLVRSLLSLSHEDTLARLARTNILISVIAVGLYTVFAFAFPPINTMLGGISRSKVSYAPLLHIGAVILLYASLTGLITSYRRQMADEEDPFAKKLIEERKQQRKALFLRHLELLGFTALISFISLLAQLTDIITVTFKTPIADLPELTLSGRNLIFHADLLTTAGERTIAYICFVLFFMTVLCLFLSLVAFCSRSLLFHKIALSTLLTALASCLLVGLFGQYYRVVQTMNLDLLRGLLSPYDIPADELLDYTVTSGSMIYFFTALAVLTFLFIRRPYTKSVELSRSLFDGEATILAPSSTVNIAGSGTAAPGVAAAAPSRPTDHDPCPAFSQLDGQEKLYRAALEDKRETLIASPTLQSLVNYIVQYARDSRLHLIYTHETVAAFLAGLGTTRLTILQGMSGTGKTSLPKIFTEALHAVCDIVEVESSWRDKNELLGYYNEFSKIYTPKKFTRALYRAALEPETVTLIVLDEMNLSRIEYYFSDFLSLMEHEPDRREIRLLNTPIIRTQGGVRVEYKRLTDGTTLKIPPNVWFIGTANRDESTYDISDKVYDRAHTLNFDKRAPKPAYYGDPIPARFLPAADLIRLFEEAKTALPIDLDKYPIVAEAEKLLEPYNISFGNRIAVQIESFVSIYAACFGGSERAVFEALDIILLSKVVKKLEMKSLEDKETLAADFERLGLTRCSRFILSLKED